MKIVIIEDEPLTAENLIDVLLEIDTTIEVVAQLESIVESVQYFEDNDAPELIFSDIHLSDGLSFEIFNKISITSPVIFCTAYDEYAIQAFKANGIDYIMKPFSLQTVADALSRYKMLKKNFVQQDLPVEAIIEAFNRKKDLSQATLLVYYKDQILPIRLEKIAFFHIHNDMTYLRTFNGESYVVDHKLDQLDNVAGSSFFRVNRQYLVNRHAIDSASRFFARKLILTLNVPYKESIVVSKLKVSSFLSWLSSGTIL